ncbi:FkbM family methyltransferase [Flavobacterium sp. AED]|uniref:FkbM family methyltransferase n=1 Tax=Flavobacterium sp. AED TaxID=1423323 RepID=UPI00058045CF|nr:FkbM family methyltransferase [Flavobacterium sp. AED]KIA85245.1 hypothetical protein OA85_12675 [Flavobacterium sp. AED]
MIKIRKYIVRYLCRLNITPYLYYTYKWNNPFIIKKKLFSDAKELLIFDVGAFDGRSIELYKKSFPKSKIFSFEPTPNMYHYLKNEYSGRKDIKIFNYALSSNKGEATFNINNSLLTNSLLDSSKNEYTNSESSYNTKEKIIVETETIDNIFKNEKISKINILKIDAQGADVMVLRGAEETLKNKKIDLIYVEVEFLQLYENQPLFHELSLYLHSHGYYLYSLYNISVSKKGQMIYGDAVFLNPDIKI